MAEGNEVAKIDEKAIGLQTGQFNWLGMNPAQIKGIAQAMAMSGMFPDVGKDIAKAMVKIMAGQEMGIAPFQAMSDIAIIQGKAAAGGNIHASKVKGSAKYDYKVLEWTATGCRIEFFEKLPGGKKDSLGISEFNEADAKAAQLFGKDNWKKYPRNMYFNRAMTNGVRTYCPDALNGVNAYTPEELGATVDEDGRVIANSPVQTNTTSAKETQAQEAEVPPQVNKTEELIQKITTELDAKGIDPKHRKAITMSIGELKGTPTEKQLNHILVQVTMMDTEQLNAIVEPKIATPAPAEVADDDSETETPEAPTLPLEDPQPKNTTGLPKDGGEMPDDFLTEKDIDDADAAAKDPEAVTNPTYEIPEFKESASGMVPLVLQKFAKKLYPIVGLNTQEEIEEFNLKTCGEKKPGKQGPFLAMLGVLVDEANDAAASQ